MATVGGRERAGARPRWPYWVIAALALWWNAFGCLDFVMTASRNPEWLASLSPETIDWLDAAPTWSLFTWALGVGGGLVGALCLLARSRHAMPAFAASLLGLAGNQLWQLTSNRPDSMASGGNLALSVGVWTIALFLLWFAVRTRRQGILR